MKLYPLVRQCCRAKAVQCRRFAAQQGQWALVAGQVNLDMAPSKAARHPGLTFTADVSVFNWFFKWSLGYTVAPILGTIVLNFALPPSLNLLCLAPVCCAVMSYRNLLITVSKVRVYMDEPATAAVVGSSPATRISTDAPSQDLLDDSMAAPSALASRGGTELDLVVRDDTNPHDPWGTLIEDEVLLFTHMELHLFRGLQSGAGDSTDVEVLRDLHCRMWNGWDMSLHPLPQGVQ
eukprot:NODE_1129_length_1088_cov_93.137632_g872_i0.p1 GENE.NODE_1129_length_1088_cov_93.137632_g872_i0~~NODE_1129_length_1088_cov_93.137632_g872_i0.p1  ORF type:complete len:256 (+),score=44.94 NODE_1129_length_1088_cov_93.137632_g872_i0:64-768(+)